MSERFSDQQPELMPIKHEVLDLKNGPVDILLSDHLLRVVDIKRDLGEDEWNVDYAVIDPTDFDSSRKQGYKKKGYKGLWEDEPITLGKENTYGRFTFSDFVSREHVQITKRGSEVEIIDLGSTNGTYRLVSRARTTGRPTPHLGQTIPEEYTSTSELAGRSVPSDLHPERNEDAFFVDDTSRSLGVFDGVGGAPGSERASQFASQAVANHLKVVPTTIPRRLSHLAVYEALWAGHEAIVDGAKGMDIATTATVAKVFESGSGTPYAVVASVGDSRAYLFRDRQLAHLTLDQAYLMPGHKDEDAKLMQLTLSETTDLSKLSEDEQRAFRHRNIITSYLGGMNNPPVITITDFEVQDGDKLVITSDGIHDNLTNSELESILREDTSANLAVNALVHAARNRSRDQSHIRSKPDDMTAAVLCL